MINDIQNDNYAETNRAELATLSQIAHMYYDLDMLQPEIADKLFFSRSKVSRMLKRARDLGIVKIKVRRVLDRSPALEQKFKEYFGIKDAVIISGFDDDPADMLEATAHSASLYISNLLRGKKTIGLSLGETIGNVVNNIKKTHDCELDVVQLMGSSAVAEASFESRELVQTLMSVYGATGHYLNTPLYVDDLYAKEILLQDPIIQSTFNIMKSCNIILTGLGAFNDTHKNPSWFGYISKRHLAELKEKKAVGSMLGQFYNVNGEYIHCEWNRKCIGMPFDVLKKMDCIVCVAEGTEKTTSIIGALNGGLIDILVTDAKTAIGVIEKAKLKSYENNYE